MSPRATEVYAGVLRLSFHRNAGAGTFAR
jgi:hypothetical protein